MANLAIKGHATRGKEVIEILEMLGGKISHECGYEDGFDPNYVYFIDTNENYFIDGFLLGDKNPAEFSIFTLEQFLEKFPYKIRDKAFAFGNKCTIIDAVWDEGIDEVVYTIKLDTSKYTTTKLSNQLQPYKEETFGECIEKTIDICLFGEKEKIEEQIKIDIPEGYEISCIDNHQVLLKKIKPKYPKNYKECCKVLNISESSTLYVESESKGTVTNCAYSCSLLHKLSNFRKLLICRDAYWKIAGEQMRLGEPWKPSKSDSVYCIFRYKGDIVKDNFVFGDSLVLEFPTEEMRDAFFENFGHLIEICKELL